MKEIFALKDLGKIAKKIIREINKKNIENSTIVALSGELGVGKTTLTQELAKLLGIKEKLVSPTFVIMKKYQTNHKKFKKLIHIDAYRLDSLKELEDLGWREMKRDKNNLIILEWPERVAGCLTESTYQIYLGHQDEKTRTIEILL